MNRRGFHSGFCASCGNKKRHEVPDEFVTWHSRESAFQKITRGNIVSRDAGKIKIGRMLRLEFVKEFVAAAKNVGAPAVRRIQSQGAKVTDPAGQTVHIAG